MVGIIILNFNSSDDTIKCVASIEKYTAIRYHIYVVDGGSEDRSYNKLLRYFANSANIEIVKSKINRGYSYGNNLGVKKALKDGAESILIINPDVVLVNNAIDLLHESFSQNPKIKIAGPSILSLCGNEQQFARKKLTVTTYIFDKKPFYWFRKFFPNISIRKIDWSNGNRLFSFYGMVSGCCFLIDSEIFQKIGLFDENVFLFGEEDILAFKLERENVQSSIIPNAKVLHIESSSISKKGLAFSRFHRTISALYVLKKYGGYNKFNMLFLFVYSIIPFLIVSSYDKSYRKYLRKLVKRSFDILKRD